MSLHKQPKGTSQASSDAFKKVSLRARVDCN